MNSNRSGVVGPDPIAPGERKRGDLQGTKRTWTAETVRVSLFPAAGAPARDDLWQTITGAKPDATTTTKEGMVQQQGTVDGKRYLLVSMPGRVDLFMSPPEDADEIPPNIGPHTDALTAVKGFGSRLAEQLEAVTRIGVGGVILHFLDSKKDAYAALERRFPCLNFAKDAADDFLLQLNRPIRSAVITELQMNRIVRWAYLPVHQAQLLVVQALGPSGPTSSSRSSPTTTVKHAVRLDIDVNTAAANTTAFSKDQSAALVAETADKILGLVDDALDGGK